MPRILRTIITVSVFATLYSLFDSSILRFGMDPYLVHLEPIPNTLVRFVLFQFLHGGIFHLLGNILFLWYFGSAIERSMGEERFLAFFAFATIFIGSALILFADGNTIGASGFAMAILTYAAMRMKESGNPEYRSALLFVGLNVAFGFFGNISLVAHAAGAVA